MQWFPKYNIILASKSPRRYQLLQSLGIDFRVVIKEIEENYPLDLRREQIPVFLAELKAKPFWVDLKVNDLVITADTIVCFNERVLGKPKSKAEAKHMLHLLSGNTHEVITGVCLISKNKRKTFYSSTSVQFKTLTENEIDYYISTYKPFDKAGAYGIQEWIGTIGITCITGSFYNVMGLPIQMLYEEIQKF